MNAGWLAITAGACTVIGFAYYWLGVGRAERRFAADFDAVFAAYAAMKRERDALVDFTNDLIDQAGVLTPAERDAFDRITARLENLR